jgi:hypothetical protein
MNFTAIVVVALALFLVILAVGCYMVLASYISLPPFKKKTKEEGEEKKKEEIINNVKFNREDNMSYAQGLKGGTEYVSVKMASRDDCEVHCGRNKNCLAYTYISPSTCYIVKTSNYTKKPLKGRLAGYKTSE